MTDTIYKITTQDNTTHSGYIWEPGTWYETDGSGHLYLDGWIHAYTDPLLAILLNPIHAGIENPKLWEAEGDGRREDDHGLKVGYTRMRIVREIDVPVVSQESRVRFAIYCAREVFDNTDWNSWADKWLSGEGRSHPPEKMAREAEIAARQAWSAKADGTAAEIKEDAEFMWLQWSVCWAWGAGCAKREAYRGWAREAVRSAARATRFAFSFQSKTLDLSLLAKTALADEAGMKEEL